MPYQQPSDGSPWRLRGRVRDVVLRGAEVFIVVDLAQSNR